MNSAGVGGYFQSSGSGVFTQSVQRGTIDLNNVTSATATIASVVTAQSSLSHLGAYSGTTSTTVGVWTVLALTNATTVTASHVTSVATASPVSYEVYESAAGTWKSMQRGTIDLAGGTSQTATITSVVTSKSSIKNLGFSINGGGGMSYDRMCAVALTNATTVTASAGAGTGSASTNGYEVREANT